MSEMIGTLFLETRQAKGLTVEAAAEAIRIRTEYVEAIENDSFDFDLPDIYKRGFYKTYADFLGLNTEDVMARCPIKPFETLESSQKRREMVSQVAKKTQVVNHDNIKVSFTDDADNSSISTSPSRAKFDQVKVAKIAGIILASATLLFLMLYGIIHYLKKKSTPEIAKDNIVELIQKRIILHSSNDVNVVVRNKSDKSKIFSGSLKKGNEKEIVYRTPIQIFFDHGESLLAEMDNGRHIHPDSGRGCLQIE